VPDWRDLTEEEAFNHVLDGGSLCIEAYAGTGKSTFLRRCAAALREKGKRVQCCALTHVAVANLRDPSAQTLARLTHSYGQGKRNRFDVLVLDEFSMVDTAIWCAAAAILHHSGAQLIVAGDWLQLQPVCDVLLGLQCPSMQNRDFLRERCGSNRLILRKCWRSDPRLFNFYKQVAESSEDVSVFVERAKREFPPIEGPSPINLVACHVRRIALNAELMERFKPTDRPCFWVEPGPSNARHNQPQPMWLWLGQELICASPHHGLRRQWPYTVVELSAEHVVL
jgi:hypothetical protein